MNYPIGTGNTNTVNAWNNFSLVSRTGYINLVKIKIVNTYVNYPLRFTINGRKFDKPVNLTVRFNGNDSADPGIDRYTLDSEILNDYNYKFYIAKTSPGIWDIYVCHPAWTSIAVTNAEIFRFKTEELFRVIYPNMLVDSLPEGSLEFTAE